MRIALPSLAGHTGSADGRHSGLVGEDDVRLSRDRHRQRVLRDDAAVVPVKLADDPDLRIGLTRLDVADVEDDRSEEHTSELQSPYDLVCRLLLEKKNTYRQSCIQPTSTLLKTVS